MDAANSSASSFETISILIVDDDNACLSILAAILKKFNYHVVAVTHAKDALYNLRLNGGAFDIVVSDVHIPDMDGYELQQVITEEFNLPVILMSADDKEGIALKGLEGGAAFFIMKPISPDDVKDLWQFAALKKRSNQAVVIEDSFQEVLESLNDGATTSQKETERKNPSREGSEEINDGNSPSSSKKRGKIVWTDTLHNHFLEAIRSIGLEKAVPKKILEIMSIPGLTRENVASHLQKYRIFLRRVSEASCKIQYSPKKELGISPELRVGNHQNPNHSNVGTPLPNIGASSSTQFGESRLFPNNGARYKPPIGTSTLTPRHPCITPMPNNFEARDMANVGKDHSGIATPSSFGTFPDTSTYGVPAQNTANTYETNYVGYRLSSLQSLANDNGQEMLSIGVSDNRSMLSGYQNGENIQESNDLVGFNKASAQQALDEGGLKNTWPNDQLTNVLDQPQQQDVGGETNISSNLYDDVVQWHKFVNASYSFDQAFIQSESSELELNTTTEGLATSSHINGIVMEPNNERNDDDFLESLLAPNGEGHNFHEL